MVRTTDKNARLAVRPRNIVLLASENTSTLLGTVKKVSYVGSHFEYSVMGTFGEIFAIEDSGLPINSEGGEVSITFKDGGSCLVPI